MAGRVSFRPSPETCFAVGDCRHFVPAQPTPRQSRLLAALPQQEYQRLVPDLEPCPLPLGWTIHDAGDRERYLYFITTGIVSRFYVTASGASAEFAVTGNEGVIGIAAFLGGEARSVGRWSSAPATVIDCGQFACNRCSSVTARCLVCCSATPKR